MIKEIWSVTQYGYEKYSINGPNGEEICSTWKHEYAYRIANLPKLEMALEEPDTNIVGVPFSVVSKARKICAKIEGENKGYQYLSGERDEYPEMQMVITAIVEITELSATAMDNLCFYTPIEELTTMTKQDLSVKTCHEGSKLLRSFGHIK